MQRGGAGLTSPPHPARLNDFSRSGGLLSPSPLVERGIQGERLIRVLFISGRDILLHEEQFVNGRVVLNTPIARYHVHKIDTAAHYFV